jgi:hypothetical protein
MKMKYLKKFNESENNSENIEDLELITRIALDLENLIFDDLGIEIEKSDNFSRGLEENEYFISFYPENTLKELIPDRLRKAEGLNKDKICVLFKISVPNKSDELKELIRHYFDERLKKEGYQFQKEINQQIIPTSTWRRGHTYQQYRQYYYFSYLIDI